MIRWLLLVAFVAIATGASVAANWWFYSSLGADLFERGIYAAMGVGLDGFKVVGLSTARALQMAGWHGTAWAARVFWLIAVLASLVAAIGFTAAAQANREDPTSQAIKERRLVESQLAEDTAALERLLGGGPAPVSVGASQAALDALLDSTPAGSPGPLRSVLVGASGGLCDGTYRGPLTVRWCPDIREAEGMVSRAKAYDELTASIRRTREKLAGIETPANEQVEHPGFVTIATVTTASAGLVKGVVLFVFAIAIEGIAAGGWSFIQGSAGAARSFAAAAGCAIMAPINWFRRCFGGTVAAPEVVASTPAPAPAASEAAPEVTPEPAAASDPETAPEPPPDPVEAPPETAEESTLDPTLEQRAALSFRETAAAAAAAKAERATKPPEPPPGRGQFVPRVVKTRVR